MPSRRASIDGVTQWTKSRPPHKLHECLNNPRALHLVFAVSTQTSPPPWLGAGQLARVTLRGKFTTWPNPPRPRITRVPSKPKVAKPGPCIVDGLSGKVSCTAIKSTQKVRKTPARYEPDRVYRLTSPINPVWFNEQAGDLWDEIVAIVGGAPWSVLGDPYDTVRSLGVLATVRRNKITVQTKIDIANLPHLVNSLLLEAKGRRDWSHANQSLPDFSGNSGKKQGKYRGKIARVQGPVCGRVQARNFLPDSCSCMECSCVERICGRRAGHGYCQGVGNRPDRLSAAPVQTGHRRPPVHTAPRLPLPADHPCIKPQTEPDRRAGLHDRNAGLRAPVRTAGRTGARPAARRFFCRWPCRDSCGFF